MDRNFDDARTGDPVIDGAAAAVTVEDLSSIVEHSLNEIYVFGLETLRFLYVNQPARDNLGYAASELAALTPVDLKPELTREQFTDLVAPLRDGRQDRLVFETRHQRKNGSTYPVEVHLQPGYYSGQRVATAIILDITERARAQEAREAMERQLQQAQKMESLGILAGGIAHDFNNILTSILGFADLAMEDIDGAHPAREHISELVKGARRGAELTQQMLAYSGKGKFVVEPVNLQSLIADMGRLLQVSIPRSCGLHYHFAPTLPAIRADATQIRQVLLNLIINAAEAIGPETSGIISVTTGSLDCDEDYLLDLFPNESLQPGTYVCLEVSDSGAGMDETTRKRIFDPFFTTKDTGRGLGLSAILGIVLGHGGSIKVYSEPGAGSSFKLLFPALAEAADSMLTETAPANHWQGAGKVLVVEDEDLVLALAEQLFRRMGFEVITSTDGVEGLAAFREHHADLQLVFLDMNMPNMGGEEAFREMRRINASVPTLLCSGYNEQTAINRFAGKGLAGFIQKPYTYRTLSAVVKDVIEGG
ncbi:hybrid sensor histidine kinase/response regulator [Chromatocurvus halotolerans]|uniref:histidine kinase n=1 Tax=Chromatocurvus halotolerans TaxID=1132028 RepID=A0A4R2LGI6_9GAMM|nr:response regulator [Chromatocurvus halotolerans]TCO78425.1 PAS domain S-box-containing protein [Chromatocurvus halotolerans]